MRATILIAVLSVALLAHLLSPGPADARGYEYRGLSSAEYQSMFDVLVPQGYRPVHIRGYGGRTATFDVTFEQNVSGAWEARHDLDNTAFRDHSDALLRRGFRLILHSAYRVNGTLYNAAVWGRE